MTDMNASSAVSTSQFGLLMEYFKKNPNRDIRHPEIVDWATTEYARRTGKVFRDPDRGIRSLHQSGFLQKIAKGVYRYQFPLLIPGRHESAPTAVSCYATHAD